jgi:hypothetical protein
MIFAQASSGDLGGDLSFNCSDGQRRRENGHLVLKQRPPEHYGS